MRLYLTFIIICLSISAYSQIQINSSYTPQQLVQNFFVGGGVTVTNVSFQGLSGGTGCSQIAYFSNGNTTPLGMASGIVLATGCVQNVAQSGNAFMNDQVGGPGLPLINQITGGTSYDGAMLSFDFIPQDSPIMFRYVFGSEEYPEYVGSQYNDGFGFFVTGPNPSGGTYNNVNIALIPNTSTPVTINNVNGGSYSQYYINNNGSSNQPVFDGFTTPLVAQLNVVPCQQYTIRIAIADVGDRAFDSGVFLERNSLVTDAIDLTITYSTGSAPAVEGCSYATITASTAVPPTSPVTITWTISGTATNGVDCNTIPTQITIPAGQTSSSITVTPILDGLTEGLEYIVLTRVDACGNTKRDTIYFQDNSPLSVNAGQDQTLCQSALPATLTATPNGGAAPFEYQWSNNSNSQTIQVSPTSTTQYNVTVTDACGQTATDNVVVNIIPNPTSNFTANTPICAGDIVNVVYTGNASASATYNWNFSGATIISGGTGQGPHQITWNTAGNYNISLTITEGGCNSQPSQQSITVYDQGSSYCCTMPNPNAGPDKNVCGFTTNLEAIPSMNGMWTSVPPTANILQPNNPNSQVTVPSAGTYQFIWTESTSASCVNRDTVVITFIQQPQGDAGTSAVVCSHTYQMSASASIGIGTWSVTPSNGVNIAASNNPNTTVTVQNDGVYTFTWTVNNNGCINTSQVQIGFYQMPNANAGPDNAVCQLNYTLQAIPSVGIGSWIGFGPGQIQFSDIHSANSSVTVTTTGTYMFVWTEDNSNGCVDSDTVVIQLTQTPTSSFTATNINCYGQPSNVTYTGIAGSGSVFTWNWDGGSVIPGTGPGPHQVSWSTAGSHTISLTVSLNGCTSSPTTVVLFNPTPITTSLSKVDLLCKGDMSGSINLTVSGGTAPYSYQWNNGAAVEDLSAIPGGIYTVTVTDSNGCTKTDGITVNEPSALVISLTPSQYICQHMPAYLNISASGGTPPYQYFWDGQPSNPSIVVTPTTNTTYSAYVVDANGCQSQLATTTVYVAPEIHVNIMANTTSVCPGDPVVITPVIWGGVGPPYAVYNHNGDLVTPPIYIYPTQSGWYHIRVEDACISWDTASIYINVYPLPPVNILADTLQGCRPLTVHFIEVNPDSGQTYLWNFGDNSNLSLAKNPVHTYQSAGVFDVSLTVTSIYGCKNTVVYNDMIKVWPTPVARFTWHPEIVTEAKPVINFVNLSSGAYTYQWMFGDGDSSSHINPIHQYPKAGEYEVQLVALTNKGCKDTTKAIVKILEQYTFYAPTAFSPDGDRNNDYFYIMAHGIKQEGFMLEIYDRWGEIIWKTDKFYKELERSEKWDGRAKNNEILPVGTYTWRCVFRDAFDRTNVEAGSITIIR